MLLLVFVKFRKKNPKSKNHQAALSSQETVDICFLSSLFQKNQNKAMFRECIADSPLGPA